VLAAVEGGTLLEARLDSERAERGVDALERGVLGVMGAGVPPTPPAMFRSAASSARASSSSEAQLTGGGWNSTLGVETMSGCSCTLLLSLSDPPPLPQSFWKR